MPVLPKRRTEQVKVLEKGTEQKKYWLVSTSLCCFFFTFIHMKQTWASAPITHLPNVWVACSHLSARALVVGMEYTTRVPSSSMYFAFLVCFMFYFFIIIIIYFND